MCRDGHHADSAWMVVAFRVLRSEDRTALAEAEPTGLWQSGRQGSRQRMERCRPSTWIDKRKLT